MPSIRPATPDDAVALAGVHIASWKAAYEGLLPPEDLDELSEQKLAHAWKDRMERGQPPGARVLVLTDDAQVIGYSHVGPARDHDSILEGETGEIYGLYLHPDRWGRGWGRALMDASVEDLSSRGFSQATLNVVEGNERARIFYERQGWSLDKQAAPWHGAPQLRYRKEF